MHGGFFDMRDCVFDRAAEAVLRDCFRSLRRLDCRFRCFHNPGSLQRRNFNDLAAERAGHFCRIDFVSVLFNDIHHIDGNHNGNSELRKLRRQIQISFQVCSVHDI